MRGAQILGFAADRINNKRGPGADSKSSVKRNDARDYEELGLRGGGFVC